MTSIAISAPRMRTADHRDSLRPLALAAPLLLLLLFSFGAPIVALLSRAIYEPTIANALPHTIEALRLDDAVGVPGEAVFAALAADLKEVQGSGGIYEFAKKFEHPVARGAQPGAASSPPRGARGDATSRVRVESEFESESSRVRVRSSTSRVESSRVESSRVESSRVESEVRVRVESSGSLS